MRKLLTISVASMLAVAPALAQQTGPGSQPSSPPSSMPDKSSPPSSMDKSEPVPGKTPGAAAQAPDAKTAMGDYRASNLLNASLKNAAGESVGSINDLLLDGSGKITHVIVGVGGFLGIGERDVALKFEQVQLSRDSNNRLSATASVTKESLKTAPEWKDPSANTSQTSSPSPTPSKPSR